MSRHIPKLPPLKPWKPFCECTKPAVVKKAGSWVCQECLDMERNYYGTNKTGHKRSIPHHDVDQ